jgi:hypothetical protein
VANYQNGDADEVRVSSARTSFGVVYAVKWSSVQSSWLLTQRSRVRFPALPDFLSSSGSGTGSTHLREDN